MPENEQQKVCFVIMGFGEKTDFEQQKKFDLDKSYRVVIKKAVENAGLKCIRADDVIHSGVIDKPMYEYLLDADVVVADLSTSNANAIYELGVRHALRPHTTIVLAEENFKFPFDIGHVLIRQYQHLGAGIDAEEAERIRGELEKAISELLDKKQTDSPVYTFLPNLRHPARNDTGAGAEELRVAVFSGLLHDVPVEDQAVGTLMDRFREARARSDFLTAKDILQVLRKKLPNDPFIIQQLALASYKSEHPNAESALQEARKILRELKPGTTNDPETLGLWGALHKRLWELEGERQHLDEAIRTYEKGFFLKDDYYNGINFSFLLNVRASISQGRDAIADFVQAERVRRRVIQICEELLRAGIKDEEGKVDAQDTFWLRATLVEAFIGIGERDKAEALKTAAIADAPEAWMADTMNEQIDKLQRLLSKVP